MLGHGIFSSRRIERATYRDIAVRYLTGNTHPDPGTLCTFRRNHQEAMDAALVQVRELARELKRLKLGTVSLEGTLIRAHASKDKNLTCPRAQPQPREGHAQDPSSKPPPAAPAPEAQIHLTDPDLRLMRKNRREGCSQGYNAQVVVDAEGSTWIVGQRVSNSATDEGQWEPGLQSIPQELGQPTAVLADCGYASKEDFQRLGRQRPGLALYGSVHWEEAHAPRRYDDRPLDKVKSPRRLRDPVWVAMAEKLKRPEGRALDRRRLCTVEPVFGVIQAVLGFGPFLLRGLQKVRGEWALVCLAYNGSGCTGSGRGWAWRGRTELWAFGCRGPR